MATHNEEYWTITAEWAQVYEQPSESGIVGEKRRFVQREVGMSVINVHPVLHGIRMLQKGYLKYAILFAMPIPKKYFDLVTQPSPAEQKVSEIADKVEAENSEKGNGIHLVQG